MGQRTQEITEVNYFAIWNYYVKITIETFAHS